MKNFSTFSNRRLSRTSSPADASEPESAEVVFDESDGTLQVVIGSVLPQVHPVPSIAAAEELLRRLGFRRAHAYEPGEQREQREQPEPQSLWRRSAFSTCLEETRLAARAGDQARGFESSAKERDATEVPAIVEDR